MIETWDKEEWAIATVLCIIFPPVGIAMILRKWTGRRVFGSGLLMKHSNELKQHEIDYIQIYGKT